MRHTPKQIIELYNYLKTALVGQTSGQNAKNIAKMVAKDLTSKNGYMLEDFTEEIPWLEESVKNYTNFRASHG